MQYEIPKEIKTKPKLFFFLYVKDFFILIMGAFILTNVTSEYVHSWFKIPYYTVGFGFLLFMLANSTSNPGKKNYHTFYFLLKRNRYTYHALDVHKVLNDKLFRKET